MPVQSACQRVLSNIRAICQIIGCEFQAFALKMIQTMQLLMRNFQLLHWKNNMAMVTVGLDLNRQ